MLIKPIVSEKTLKDAAKHDYTFAVELKDTKPIIKTEVEKAFGVTVLKVKTAVMPGKGYRSGKRWIFKHHSDWKKAIVTIKPDQKIDLFETPSEEVKQEK